jgi:hypothetical protein
LRKPSPSAGMPSITKIGRPASAGFFGSRWHHQND